ncbi:MAG: S-methyl-5'-thioadenosine phosphorylase [Thermoanaerobaculia bacterium]|nr:S-methyl-5'-thioadenosine phosphorylase [Thermoanaerobaculia bacterium]
MTLHEIPRIGLVGGSGLYSLPSLERHTEVVLETPFGSPSDAFVLGAVDGVAVAFLARHGRGHRVLPSEINFRANIWGFKKLCCDALVSISACGSMKKDYQPGHIVLPDQFIDRTVHRASTFFGEGCVAHVSMAHPVCPELLGVLDATAREAGAATHRGGTYLCMEGPQFSTKAESLLYRSWGVDVIGMTNYQEAKLCREAEICYATMALVTDYDCWHEEEQAVSVEAILDTLHKNAETANRIVTRVLGRIRSERPCGCRSALASAILTRPEGIPERSREKLALIAGKYWE